MRMNVILWKPLESILLYHYRSFNDSIYRPPDHKSFLSKFSSTVDRFLPGDFNFNLLPGNQDTNSSNPTSTQHV